MFEMSLKASDYAKQVSEWVSKTKDHQYSIWMDQLRHWHCVTMGAILNQQLQTNASGNHSEVNINNQPRSSPIVEYQLPFFWKRIVAGIVDICFSGCLRAFVSGLCEETGLFSKWTLLLLEYICDCGFYVIFSTGNVFGMSTPGKRLMGLRIVSCHELVTFLTPTRVRISPGRHLEFSNAVIRWFFRSLHWFFPFFLFISFPHNQSMHDFYSSSIVVESN